MNESAKLIVAIACALLFWATIAILVWTNPRSRTAWYIAIGSLLWSPLLITFGAALELLFVVAMVTIWVTHGFDISKPLSAKAFYWTIGTTSAYLIVGSVVGLLLFGN